MELLITELWSSLLWNYGALHYGIIELFIMELWSSSLWNYGALHYGIMELFIIELWSSSLWNYGDSHYGIIELFIMELWSSLLWNYGAPPYGIMEFLIMELWSSSLWNYLHAPPSPPLVRTHIFFSHFTSYMVFRTVSHTLLLPVNANSLGNDKITTPILLGLFLTAIYISNSSPFVWLGLYEV
jgi:hypothetical protein